MYFLPPHEGQPLGEPGATEVRTEGMNAQQADGHDDAPEARGGEARGDCAHEVAHDVGWSVGQFTRVKSVDC